MSEFDTSRAKSEPVHAEPADAASEDEFRSARILIVDDSATSRMKLVLAARRLGHETLEAPDGAVALQMLRQGAVSGDGVDLVLLDIAMPKLDGHGVLARMREASDLSDIPVIVVTGSGGMSDAVRAIEAGASDVLPKGFEPVLFRARVEACLERKRLDDARAAALRETARERDRIDALLAATLPERAIAELKATGEVRPRRFENVAVLFADVVSFTAFCDTRPPEEAVARLRTMVSGFEEIAEEHGLEKIKTIGDAFMATAGLLRPLDDPFSAAARAGLAMAAAAPLLSNGWQVRVGIQSGPVVAGVIGRQKHLFDLWGDTVNVADRIAGLAEPGTVQVGQALCERLPPDMFRATPLGCIAVAGKGPMPAFRIEHA